MIAFLKRLFAGSSRADQVALCYARMMEQARRPEFYLAGGVPDTLDGRYEMLALHAFFLAHRLKGQGEEARLFSRDLFESMISEMDRTVREMGAADMGVAPRVKRMAKGFTGRILAYDRGVAAAGDEALLAALDNNLYGTVLEVPPATLAAMAGYIRSTVAGLAAQPLESLLAGEVCFPDPALAGGSVP
ncbi:MAG: ubiquinol-cytochrome C chaperone family protein [Rhodospirillaceae bacterium]